MSLPTFPADPAGMTREDAVNQIISSIAMEELGLSHILNAEGEKLQYVLGTLTEESGLSPTIDELLKVNGSVQQTLNAAMQSQMFLHSKMAGALGAATMQGPTGADGATPAIGPNGNWFVGGKDTGVPATGPAGAPGAAIAQPYDGADVYLKGQIIDYNGLLYIVNRDNPQGIPGNSADYSVLLRIGGTAPTFAGTEAVMNGSPDSQAGTGQFTIPPNGAIIFDELLYDGNPNVSYDSSTGQFSLNQAGSYLLNWWTSIDWAVNQGVLPSTIQLSIAVDGVPYSTVSVPNEGGGFIYASGNTFVNVQTPPAVITLVNITAADLFLMGLKLAGILITQVA